MSILDKIDQVALLLDDIVGRDIELIRITMPLDMLLAIGQEINDRKNPPKLELPPGITFNNYNSSDIEFTEGEVFSIEVL